MAGVCDHNMCIEITMSTSNSLKHILYMCVRLRMKLEYAFFNPTAKSVIFFFRTNHIYLSCLNISTLCIIKNDDISIFSKIVCFINVNNFAEYTSVVIFTAIPEVWLKITCCWSFNLTFPYPRSIILSSFYWSVVVNSVWQLEDIM